MQPPQIDLQQPQATVCADLDRACREWGLFYLVGHDLDERWRVTLLEVQRAFFASSPANKQRILRSAENPWGFYDQELTKNRRDSKEIFDVGPASGSEAPQWPLEPSSFAEHVRAHYAASEVVARAVLALLERNLGAQSGSLSCEFDTQTSFLRLNYYPLSANPAAEDATTLPTEGELGIHHHTDAGALTVLVQDDQAGLQVQHGDRWVTLPPRRGAALINIGDIVQVWSNDQYLAPTHRVLASTEAERHSAAFFFNPSYATQYAPLPTMCESAPPRYTAINWGQFRSGRAAGDYANYGSEIQISDFRIDPDSAGRVVT